MDYGFFKVRALSPHVTAGDPKANAESSYNLLLSENTNAQAAVLPELFLSGASCGDLFRQDILLDECENALFTLAEKTKDLDTLVAVGMPLKVENGVINAMAVIQKGEILGFVPKTTLSAKEQRWFTSQCAEATVNLRNNRYPVCSEVFKIGNLANVKIVFGSELRAPYGITDGNIILCPDYSEASFDSPEGIKDVLHSVSKSSHCTIAYANANMNESTTDGVCDSYCAVYENGKLLAESDCFTDNSDICACTDCESLNALRRQSAIFNDIGCAHGIDCSFVPLEENEIDINVNPYPFVLNDESKADSRCEQILKIQANALVRRLRHVHSAKTVLGISGGLDSTLALLVCAKAMDIMNLPRENIICITLPGFGTTGQTYENALELIRSVGGTEREISIKPACIQHMQDIGHDMNIHDVTYENTQARERTQILMDVANKEGALLIGTGDLSELALGWCTYNGDHMSMYSVNADITKTLIRRIVSYYIDNTDARTADVLQKILDTPVSPELLPPDENGEIAQMTEEKLGPYEVHDFYIYYFLKFGTRPAKMLFLAEKAFPQYSRDELKSWLKNFLRRFFGSQFKRSCMPDGPAICRLNLSPRGGLSMPSDAMATIWLNEAKKI